MILKSLKIKKCCAHNKAIMLRLDQTRGKHLQCVTCEFDCRVFNMQHLAG